MNEYKIENNMPIPEEIDRNNAKYPFSKMQIGDSFLFEGDRNTITSAASYFGKRNNVKFTVRKVGESKFRVWRTK